jgi:hypothetical protein
MSPRYCKAKLRLSVRTSILSNVKKRNELCNWNSIEITLNKSMDRKKMSDFFIVYLTLKLIDKENQLRYMKRKKTIEDSLHISLFFSNTTV